jgi:eukaryotic-like serine/threonine-protein kinase
MSSFTERLGNVPESEPFPASPAEIRAQLHRILGSAVFLDARRPSAFLSFIVETSLTGGAGGIKEYLIGIEVFDRPSEYDPKDDPIVRIEAGRLRKKLTEYYAGPGARDPILIEVPKGGYVPVFQRRAGPAEPEETHTSTLPDVRPAPQEAPASHNWKLWKILATACLLLAVLIGAGLYYRSYGVKPLTEQDTLVLADFTNTTGDTLFDGALKTALTVALRQSPFLNVLPDSKAAKSLKLMALPPDTKLTPEVARALCQRAGGKAFVAGAIASLDREYVLQLKAVNCQDGDVLAKTQVSASDKGKVVDALGHAASELRVALGESLNTVRRFDTPLAEATTPSLEALKAFTLGRNAVSAKGEAAALPYHLRAIELDPGFATAYRAAGADYDGLGETGRAAEYYTKAFQVRERASEEERLLIAGIYYQGVTGELDKAIAVYQQQIQDFPHRAYYTGLGNLYLFKGEYKNAAKAHAEDLRRWPDVGTKYRNLATTMLAMQDLDQARRIVQQAHARNLDDFAMRETLYALAFIQRDSSALAEQQHWFAGKPEENYGLSLDSDTEAYFGRLANAREKTRQAVDSAVHADSKETAAVYAENAALREAAFGNMAAARQAASQGLKMAPNSTDAAAEAALAFAMAGDETRAKSLTHDLNQRLPLHTQMQSLWLPAIRAQLALQRKNPAEAVDDLTASSSMELALIPFVVNISCMYPTYIRGEAYLAAGEGRAAAAEFQRILDHSGIVWNCWTGSLAHLGVARANALESRTLQGAEADAARARGLAAYKDFLDSWKNADPNLPLLKQAKGEFAQLR